MEIRGLVHRMVDRDLRDVCGIARGAAEAVDNRREGEQFLPPPRGDMVGEPVDQLLVLVEVVHRRIRSVNVRGQQSGEGLVQDCNRGLPGDVHLLE